MNSGMGFALSHMEKCGWKEGQGLGREETGMKEAIKVKLKFDSTGFGHDRAEEFKFQWWDHVFNKAAENISVAKNEKGVIELKRKEELVVSKSRPSVSAALMKEKLYGSFVKGATLHGSEEISTADSSDDESDDNDEPRDMSMKLSDDQLFKLCGGKTAHKGARHGLNMNAKLERIRQQEEELMNKWKLEASQDLSQLKNEVQDSGKVTPKIKKSKPKEADTKALINSEYLETNGYGKDICNKEITCEKKNKKRKRFDKDAMDGKNSFNKSEQDLCIVKKKKHKKESEDSSFSNIENMETKNKRKHSDDNIEKKKKKKIKTLIDQDTMTDSGIECVEGKIKDSEENIRKKKKHKNKKSNEDIQECENKLFIKDDEHINEQGQRKKKKNKKHNDESDLTSEICFKSSDTLLKKKTKKIKKTKEMVMVPVTELDIDESNILSPMDKEKKKKKSEKKICSTEVEVKIKKKKKSKK